VRHSVGRPVSGRQILLVCLFFLAALPLVAQDSTQQGTGAQGTGTQVAAAQGTGTQGAAASAGPGEPDLVMPQVILQVEDLSVEKVVAQLPPEEELLPPERPTPVLAEGDLDVGDPTLGQTGTVPDVTAVPAENKLLSADIMLGTGLQNQIVGTMSLKTLGADPRFSLSFNHETLDGYWLQKPGSGFTLRNDLLDGSLKFGAGNLDASLAGSFSETENGLQGQSSYGARLARSVSGTADFTATPLGWLTLGAGADVGTDTLTLSAASPLQRGDFLVSPRLSAQARFGAVSVGLQSSYSYRTENGTGGGAMQRFSVGSTFTADLPGTFILGGGVAWFWNSQSLSLFPFSLELTGTPWEFITLSLSGGYKVQQYNLRDAITSQSFSLPGTLGDDHGWFGSGSVQLAFSRDLSANFAAAFMASQALPMGVLPSGALVQDPTTNLFSLTQGPGNQFSADGGLRWAITPAFSLSAGWHHEFTAYRPFFTPTDTLTAEIVGVEPSGAYGGNLSLAVSPTPAGLIQQPLLRLSGFWKVSDAVKLQLNGDDLLLPVFGGTRTDIGPFEAPGFRISGSVEISL
jgi:hypothetical protein